MGNIISDHKFSQNEPSLKTDEFKIDCVRAVVFVDVLKLRGAAKILRHRAVLNKIVNVIGRITKEKYGRLWVAFVSLCETVLQVVAIRPVNKNDWQRRGCNVSFFQRDFGRKWFMGKVCNLHGTCKTKALENGPSKPVRVC